MLPFSSPRFLFDPRVSPAPGPPVPSRPPVPRPRPLARLRHAADAPTEEETGEVVAQVEARLREMWRSMPANAAIERPAPRIAFGDEREEGPGDPGSRGGDRAASGPAPGPLEAPTTRGPGRGSKRAAGTAVDEAPPVGGGQRGQEAGIGVGAEEKVPLAAGVSNRAWADPSDGSDDHVSVDGAGRRQQQEGDEDGDGKRRKRAARHGHDGEHDGGALIGAGAGVGEDEAREEAMGGAPAATAILFRPASPDEFSAEVGDEYSVDEYEEDYDDFEDYDDARFGRPVT